MFRKSPSTHLQTTLHATPMLYVPPNSPSPFRRGGGSFDLSDLPHLTDTPHTAGTSNHAFLQSQIVSSLPGLQPYHSLPAPARIAGK
eukprot:jgi/Botrbrau1/20346/Bobra.0006s0016.1